MNLLDKLPLLDSGDAVESFESLEIEDKKARIQFHRDRVRNGPVKFSEPTSGQIRRAQVRDLNRRTRKARKAQVRGYFAAQAEGATLRGHLQQAGVIAFATPKRKIDETRALNSVTWILARYGVLDIEAGAIDTSEMGVRAALQSALNRYQALYGLPESLIEWNASA